MAMVVHRSRSAGLVFGLGRSPGFPALGEMYSTQGIVWTGNYDPAIDASPGYVVSPAQYGELVAARSNYQIAQLQATGATHISLNPVTGQYYDADKTTPSYEPVWTDADQAALDRRISTVLADPSTAPSIKTLVTLPGYGTPEFDKAVNSGTNTLLTTQVNTLLTNAHAEAPAPIVPTGESYLVGGVHFTSLAQAQAAQRQLASTGETLLPAAKQQLAADMQSGGGDYSGGGGGGGGGGGAFGTDVAGAESGGGLLASMPGGMLGVVALGLAIFAASSKGKGRRR